MALGEVDYGLMGVVGGLTAFVIFSMASWLVGLDAFISLQSAKRALRRVNWPN